MRELKFRAWVADHAPDYGEHPECVMFYSTKANSTYMLGDRSLKCCGGSKPAGVLESFLGNPRTPVMQYTGLKDKNGKEIYEGDVVQGGVYYGWENETGFGIVKFGKWEQDGSCHEYGPVTCLGFFIDIKESKFNYIEGSHLNSEKAPFLEVIGNIYENPELLQN